MNYFHLKKSPNFNKVLKTPFSKYWILFHLFSLIYEFEWDNFRMGYFSLQLSSLQQIIVLPIFNFRLKFWFSYFFEILNAWEIIIGYKFINLSLRHNWHIPRQFIRNFFVIFMNYLLLNSFSFKQCFILEAFQFYSWN